MTNVCFKTAQKLKRHPQFFNFYLFILVMLLFVAVVLFQVDKLPNPTEPDLFSSSSLKKKKKVCHGSVCVYTPIECGKSISADNQWTKFSSNRFTQSIRITWGEKKK